MKQLIIYLIITTSLFSETKNWASHSAYLLPSKRWEIGVFQPFRYGVSEKTEISVYPIWFFVIPNFSIKKPQSPILGFTSASQFKAVYPTPLLNMISKKGIMGIIAPELQMPPMLGLSATWLMSKEVVGVNTTLKGGLDVGLVFGELDKRSTIDLPMIYHRLGVYYNSYGIHVGLDTQKYLTPKLNLIADVDIRILPNLEGNYSVEHKMLIAWHKSSQFRVMSGYKLVGGAYPFGFEARILPYVPLAEKWVPFIEVQWAGKKL